MPANAVDLWTAPKPVVVPDSLSDAGEIASRALQLRDREKLQIASNFINGNYEVAATFVWMRTMALLRKRLSSLGMEFIGELLQRPEIDEYSDIRTAVSDMEAISLARDLGIISKIQTMRLLQSQEIINYFSGVENDTTIDQDEEMTEQEALSCLRVCVQGVLGHERVDAAEDFKSFRSKLASQTLSAESPEILKLQSSPYFFLKTALSVLLSLIKSSKGAQLEHAIRNAGIIIPKFWLELKEPERWQLGQTYAVEFSDGRKDAISGLHAVLLSVNGFDYVPENLRSNTFTQVANSVIAAHQAMNNFYNEQGPMKELDSLGTSIPGPALAICITAVLCVKLGNHYGIALSAQTSANNFVSKMSKQRWMYYVNGKLENDRIILSKLTEEKPATQWVRLIRPLELSIDDASSKDIRALLRATNDGDMVKVREIGHKMFQRAA